ncbi:hypothetical protein RRG40_00440 [Mycoplasmopsis felis]|uniref:hypothetical protein n=1 Tax=Mycoplasmopsis felis TaxID=33923 RepID=UPI002B001DDA|nr:hypothetical protein [Mycoplasmopsis felis]WQQ05147.1 hypothetical protein RRG59_02200 [Mycoplasmopsis felis]
MIKIKKDKLTNEAKEFLSFDIDKIKTNRNEILFRFNTKYLVRLKQLIFKIQRIYFNNVFDFDEILNISYFEVLEILKTEREHKVIPYENYFWKTLKYKILNYFNVNYNTQNKFETKVSYNLINLKKLQSKIYQENISAENYKNLAYQKIEKLKSYLNDQELCYIESYLNNSKPKGYNFYSTSKINEILHNIKEKYNKYI